MNEKELIENCDWHLHALITGLVLTLHEAGLLSAAAYIRRLEDVLPRLTRLSPEAARRLEGDLIAFRKLLSAPGHTET